MSFKTKIMKWNLIGILSSVLAAAVAGVISSRLLAIKFFGYFIDFEHAVQSPFVKQYLIQVGTIVAVVFLISLIIANSIVYMNISRKIISPLEKLRDGIRIMSEGDFHHEISYSQMDEIGDITYYVCELQKRLNGYMEQITEHQHKNMELITSISHDLRTPITTILGYTEGILDNVANTEEKRIIYLQKIKKKALELEALIEQLFLSSKLDLNKVSYNTEPCDIFAYVAEILEEIKIDIDNNGMSVSIINECNNSIVLIDPVKFRRVILNIVTNSIKYKKAQKGALAVSLQNAADSVVVSFSDNGIGIPADKLHLIFNSFYRCDDSRTDSGESSGLGLSIAKLIVEGHGGKIWARSIYGEKTTISLSLPTL